MHLGYNSVEEPVHSLILTNPERLRGCAKKSVLTLFTMQKLPAKPNLINGSSHIFEHFPLAFDHKLNRIPGWGFKQQISVQMAAPFKLPLTEGTVFSFFSRDGRMLFDYLEEKHNVSWPDLLTSHFCTAFPMAPGWTHGHFRGKVGGTGKSRTTSQNP